MAAANVKKVNCGVNDEKSELIYKLPSELAVCAILFKIEAFAEGQEIGVLEIMKDGVLVRRTTSKPFSVGSIKVRSQGKETVDKTPIYRVRLIKAKKAIDLNDFFD